MDLGRDRLNFIHNSVDLGVTITNKCQYVFKL